MTGLPATVAAVLSGLAGLLTLVPALSALCPGLCDAILTCPGFTTVIGPILTGLAAIPLGAVDAIVASVTGLITGALSPAAIGGALPGLEACIRNALSSCLAGGDNGAGIGSFFCPQQNAAPISIQITNIATNNDSDQITTQAGQSNNGNQQQTQIKAAAGDDVVIGDLNRRFDNLDNKLRFLFTKAHKKGEYKCANKSCKKSCNKY